jgi:hypothetical protein
MPNELKKKTKTYYENKNLLKKFSYENKLIQNLMLNSNFITNFNFNFKVQIYLI